MNPQEGALIPLLVANGALEIGHHTAQRFCLCKQAGVNSEWPVDDACKEPG